MPSNAYIASDGEKLMKVGKSNNPKRREKQIDLTITLTVACLDEVSAYRIESQLRQFILERGGIKHAKTVDWFVFDPQIYRMVCEFAANLDGFVQLSDEDSQEAEIAVLRRRYFQLLVEESQAASTAPEVNVSPLKAENDTLRSDIQKLQREFDKLQERSALSDKDWQARCNRLSEELGSQRGRFRDQLSEDHKEKCDYIESASYWHGIVIGLRDSMVDRGSKPIDPEALVNTLNRLLENPPVKR